MIRDSKAILFKNWTEYIEIKCIITIVTDRNIFLELEHPTAQIESEHMFITIKPSVLKIESNGDQWKSIVFHSGEIKIGFVYIWQMNNSRKRKKERKRKTGQ